ncbi:redoxin [Bacteriovorax sp. Seq25_V]|nr:redoxin [Bacteriovorax sp. Seq25_V]
MLFPFMVWANKIDMKNIEGLDLRTMENKSIELNAKFNVFMFFSASCPCSKSYFDYLNKLSEKYKDIQFFGFHSSKTLSTDVAKNYFSNFDVHFPVIQDKELKYANIFEALKTPHVFVLDAKKNIVFHGGVADSRHMTSAKNFYLENALNDISNGNQPRMAHAKALGCYIAR